ncbi:MAG: hypothetical protein ACTSWY_14145, partial [Promethearchaeota archaeon]
LADFLELQEEVYMTFYYELDMVGDIKKSMQRNIQQSQILLFIATHRSVFESQDCKFELEEAKKHGVEVIPIRGDDISWSEMKNVGLSSTLGMDFNVNEFDEFKKNLYDYIKLYKREINLFQKDKVEVDRNRLKIRNYLVNYLLNYIDSKEYEEYFLHNFENIKKLLDEIEENSLNNKELFNKLFSL